MKNTKSLTVLVSSALVVFNNEKFKNVGVVYAAEDGNVFVEENRAKLHVKDSQLKYYPITRLEAGAETKGFEIGNLDEDLVAERTKELEGLELNTKNYQQMKSLVGFFELETADMKSETLATALSDYKAKISS